MIFEACVNSAISAVEAQRGGADRVELCENLADGGCTPSSGAILYAKDHLTIPVFVMIRPRGADFCYSDDEFGIMKHDIRMAKQLGADGVVFGILLPDGRMDSGRMRDGIKEHNLLKVISETGSSEIHVYLTSRLKSRMVFLRDTVKMGDPDLPEYSYPQVDATRIQMARELSKRIIRGGSHDEALENFS